MTSAALAPAAARAPSLSFAAAIFVSAALVFTVEPMAAKMLLPLLGGSPAVWNACMAFFQVALLAGYLYAHLLQRLFAARLQVLIHLWCLALAAFFLPLKLSAALGPPPVGQPLFWLLGVLVLSLGAPFAVLSATAPLLQAWHARLHHGANDASATYRLYAASNLGSMIALLAYPVIIEPTLTLPEQTLLWAMLYSVFTMIVIVAGVGVRRGARDIAITRTNTTASRSIAWSTRALWIALAAAPSSLMLGTTTYISNDVASVPLLWVVPLALYLLTFVIAFQTKPLIDSPRALFWQAVTASAAAALFTLDTNSLFAHLLIYLCAFFFSALICHQRLAAARPAPDHLTEFYLCVSVGGVIGGLFNALVAPLVFNTVLEFPLVLILCGLARPANATPLNPRLIGFAAAGIAAAACLALLPPINPYLPFLFAGVGGVAAAMVSGRALLFTLITGLLCGQALLVPPDKRENLMTARSFFGVHRVTADTIPALGGPMHLLFHGTTIHGAQSLSPQFRCEPTTYYARLDPLGKTLASVIAAKPDARIGVVGLGAGTLAVYTAKQTQLRYFEIDAEVERIARDPRYFTYLSDCTKGAVDVVLGDARLTVAQEPRASYDLITVDAFSADTVPTHLLTVQALRIYFRALKPHGLLMLHLSNRNLKLEPVAAAAAKASGLVALMQDYRPPPGVPPIAAAQSQVMLIARTQSDLQAFAAMGGWRPARDNGFRPWTDDYSNILSPLLAQAMQ